MCQIHKHVHPLLLNPSSKLEFRHTLHFLCRWIVLFRLNKSPLIGIGGGLVDNALDYCDCFSG
jgi:hypothetical protein